MKISFYLNRSTSKVSHARIQWMRWAIAFVSCIAVSGPVGGEEATTDASQVLVAKTIQKLGAKSFIEREDAAQQLLFIGVAAESALDDSSRSKDREIRDRSRRILKLIRKQKRTGILAAFQDANKEDVAEDLPGWPQFSERYGDSKSSRKMYSSILDSEWDLVASCFSEDNEFQRRNLVMQRYRELLSRGLNYRNCQRGTALALFYISGQFPDTANHGLHQNLFSFMSNPEVRPLLMPSTSLPTRIPQQANVEDQEVVRELVGDWIIAASEPSMNDQNARTALHQARIYRLERPSQVIAERVLANEKSLPITKSNAMQSIVLRRDKTQLNLIEPFLKDRTVLGASGQRIRQLRDVALASAMALNDIDVTKIGVKPTRTGTINAFEYQSLGFITEGDREKAFETYETLLARKKQQQ